MGMRVDETWRDDLARRWDHALRTRLRQRADGHDPVAIHADVGFEPRRSAAVDDGTAANENVEALRVSHGRVTPGTGRREWKI
jgi:hypothetical protein